MTQKDAVYQAVISVLSNEGVAFKEGVDSAISLLNRPLRSRINSILMSGFASGNVELDTSFDSQAALKTYTGGLVSNWLRKDARLNGGIKAAPSKRNNVVSKSRPKDPQLKALKTLLSQTTDNEKRSEIQSFIDARVNELEKQSLV
jgi:hypothetical protein